MIFQQGVTMPIYEYRCGSCGFQKEFLQRVSDAPLTVCPECSQSTLAKLVSAAGFQLKGTGWYATDFKHSGAKPAAKTGHAANDTKAADGAVKDAGTQEGTAKEGTAKEGAAKEPAGQAATGAGSDTKTTPACT
jgi:putative FmdB family regulatory protein